MSENFGLVGICVTQPLCPLSMPSSWSDSLGAAIGPISLDKKFEVNQILNTFTFKEMKRK